MKANKIRVIVPMLAVIIVACFAWTHWFNDELQHPDVPALRLTVSQQNVWIQPASMVSMLLFFENEVTGKQEFANRILEERGVTQLYEVGKRSKVFHILFDPGFVSEGELLTAIYPKIDDPRLFAKK